MIPYERRRHQVTRGGRNFEGGFVMPVRPEFRHFYRGVAWINTRLRILTRAAHRCEQCKKPNREKVWVYASGDNGQYWSWTVGKRQAWTYCKYGGGGNFRLSSEVVLAAQTSGRLRIIQVVLAVVHLNHKPGDDRDENLRALCQWCHLHYDQLHHHETRGARKDAARPLLAGVA
jgi:hypothetical protein